MTKVTTRQTILDYLKRNHTVTARELARILQMTTANARHHLNILSADGRVKEVQQRKPGRGRPEKVYRLSGTLVGDNLSMLADALLHLSEAGQIVNMELVGRQLAGDVDLSGQSLIQRLNNIVEHLNDMHYQAHWEAGAKGPRIILGQCPYMTLIDKHPILCQMDAKLLHKLSNENLSQVQKQAQGSGRCIFILGK